MPMKIKLLLSGKTDRPYLAEGMHLYEKRLIRYIPFHIEVIPAVKKQKNLKEDELKIKEGKLIMKKIVPGDFVVLLDEKGREYSSVQFAGFIDRHMSLSGKDLVFVVGGPYGFSIDIYGRANLRLSLSKLTFSHQMVRLIFLEQLYRAFTIIKGEPYHHS